MFRTKPKGRTGLVVDREEGEPLSTATAHTAQISTAGKGGQHHSRRKQQSQSQRRRRRKRKSILRPSRSKDASNPSSELPRLLLGGNERTRLRKFMQALFRDSALPDKVDLVPRYDSRTLEVGNLLGKGTFCSVYKLRQGVVLDRRPTHGVARDESSTTTTFESSSGDDSSQACWETKPAVRNKPRRLQQPLLLLLSKLWNRHRFRRQYAVKTIHKDIVDGGSRELMVRSIAYLTAEIRIVSSLDHPHIVRLCGWGAGTSSSAIQSSGNHDDTSLFEYGDFMVLERLQRTLKTQFKEWELERRMVAVGFEAGRRYPDDAKIIGATSVNHKYNRKRQIAFVNRLYRERITIAVDLSSAIAYLHERNMLHRDIKPQNIGFDASGSVKLFDFGIAKEIIPSGKTKTRADDSLSDHDGGGAVDANERLYHLTGLAGSRPYMSPENGLRQPYNSKTDVYSFSMVLWELMTLRKLPHRRYSNTRLEETVWRGPAHERPPLAYICECPSVTSCCCESSDDFVATWILERPIRELLQRCWSPIIRQRPTMKSVEQDLGIHLAEISRADEGGRRRWSQ